MPSGNKGWYVGECPFCGKEGKFGVIFSEDSGSYNCFSGSCQEKGHIGKLLRYIGRLDLISFQISFDKEIKSVIRKDSPVVESSLETEVKPYPRGFTRIYCDSYLESRGFIERHFNTYCIGISEKDSILKQNYVIFIIEDEGCKGFVARSRRSKSWIELYNEKLKERGISQKYLRWVNSPNTEFEKLLFGFNEITPKTDTVFIVEGITSKANIDTLLGLFDREDTKCLATFGKRVSEYHILKLLSKDIKNIVLLYDPDAIEESKKYSFLLSNYFNVKVGFLENSDPGDLTIDGLYTVLDNLENPLSFSVTKIRKQNLSRKLERI